MSQKAESQELQEFQEAMQKFSETVNVLAVAWSNGDREAEARFWEINALSRNVLNAVANGDQEWARELIREAEARALLRSALG